MYMSGVFFVFFVVVFFLSLTEEPTKTGTCARDRRALQQLALNVHVKHSDLTYVGLKDLACDKDHSYNERKPAAATMWATLFD